MTFIHGFLNSKTNTSENNFSRFFFFLFQPIMARDNGPLSLTPYPARHHQRIGNSFGISLPIFCLHYIIFYYFLSCTAAAGASSKERDYGSGPKFVCTPIPPEADPSCYPPPTVAHGPSSNSQSNDNSGGNHRTLMSDEAQTTILHLRESLVRQKETILDQRETIRELTAKLNLCEGYGGHHSISHHDNHHDKYNHHGTHHNSHLDSHYNHHIDHHGHHGSNHGNHHDSYRGNHHEMHHGNHHGTHHDSHHSSHHNSPHGSHPDIHHGSYHGSLHDSHHGSSLLHHGTSAHHGSDLHHSYSGHGTELEQPKGSYSKLSSVSAEQTGKTLQTLKERLENLQARNSSSSYSSSLRELLQRKISSLEEQLHSYYRDQHESGHHDDHHGNPHIDHHDSNHSSSFYNGHMYNHHDGHHGTGHPHSHHDDHYNTGHPHGHHFDHHGTGHHEDHHNSHHSHHHGSHPYNHHNGHYGNPHHDHNYDWHRGQHYGHYDNHHNSHHNGHHMDHHNNHHGSSHHDAHHNYHHGHYDKHHDSHHGDHHGPSHYGYNHYGDHHGNHPHVNDHHGDHHGNNPHVNGHHNDNDHPQHLPFTGDKETSLQGTNHSKLETVLSQLHPSNEQGNNKKLKHPSAFLLDFPMRTNYMYARMKRSVVNEIFALTICLWLKPREGPGLGTPISYAVPGQANELVLMEWGSNPMELLINDKAVTLPINVMDGKWHHVCVTWSTRDGVWEAYQDGVKKGAGQNLSAWHPIQPGGIFILGQEQDTMGGRFDVTQSFTGELSDLQFWSRVLTANEIHTQATCGGHFVGDVMSWSEEYVEVHGGLTELPFDPCH